MILTLGHFLAEIKENEALNILSGFAWQKYRNSGTGLVPYIELILEQESLVYPDANKDGWSSRETDKNLCAVYLRQGEVQFGLQYEKHGKTIKVVLGTESANNARLGIMYGLLLGLHKECIGLHGVTLLCENEVIILSAPSGTGKTTLAKLLERYCDGIIINGDFALLHPTEDGVIFEPTPFCGTSRRCLNCRVKVSRVVFLSQSKINTWKDLQGREAVQHVMHNTFIPTWDQNMQNDVQENILKCLSMVQINSYSFAPTQEAAEVFLQRIVRSK